MLCSFENSFYIINIINTCHISCLFGLPRPRSSGCLGFPYRSLLSWISFSLSSVARLASPVLASSFAPRVSPVRKSAVVDFASLPSTSHSLTGLAPFSRVVRPEIRRNDARFCAVIPRHCEGVRRTTEAIQSANVACFIDCRAHFVRSQ